MIQKYFGFILFDLQLQLHCEKNFDENLRSDSKSAELEFLVNSRQAFLLKGLFTNFFFCLTIEVAIATTIFTFRN
jgi:hypothetical protein